MLSPTLVIPERIPLVGSQLCCSESPVGTKRTNRVGLAMSVDRGTSEVASRGREERCLPQTDILDLRSDQADNANRLRCSVTPLR
jgi:hypothetical protein